MDMSDRERVVLVDEHGADLLNPDATVRTEEKMQAHQSGLLHRAVSVFIFNKKGQLLLQKRASIKYHSPDKWTNTCCTHPLPGETPKTTASRRLKEEMGLDCRLEESFTFLYKANVGQGLTEHEFDHVFYGVSDASPQPDPAEVGDWKWVYLEELERDLAGNPEKYTVWLRRLLPEVSRTRSRKV